MTDCPRPWARGRTAHVAKDGDIVWKCFYEGTAVEQVLREAANLQAAGRQGIPAPDVMHTRADAIGMAFVDGTTMEQAMGSVQRVLGLAAAMGRLHAQIHRCSGAELAQRQEQKLGSAVAGARMLPPQLRDCLLRRLDRAGGNPGCLCHGDFHPGNIILGANGPVVIDWADASGGWPAADVCRTELLLKGAACGNYRRPMGQRVLIGVILRRYKYAYSRSLPLRPEDMAFWTPIVAAARLSEGIREEETFALEMIERHCRE